jgi:hypothetical protein
MSATNAPFGYRAAYNPSGQIRARKYTIAGSYGTGIQSGSPVKLDTDGTIIVGTTSGGLLGIFVGCEYVDATGKPNISNQWPAGQTILSGTVPTAWVIDDYTTVFEVQASGQIPQTAVGEEANTSAVTGSTFTGLSTTTLGTSGTSQAQWRIIGFGQGVDNVPNDLFTVVQVTLAQSQIAFGDKAGV